MALRAFADTSYMPLLSLRPAELRAIEELPEKTKDRLFPIVVLRPWLSANMLETGLERLADAYDDRPTIVAMSAPEFPDTLRPVHEQLASLRLPAGGYMEWCRFIADRPNFVPAIQIADPEHIAEQISCFHALGRGLAIIVDNRSLPGLQALATIVGGLTDGGIDTCFVVDLGKQVSDPLERAVFVASYCTSIRQHCPHAAIAISASSFPADFVGREHQEIFERTLFNAVAGQFGAAGLVYSDRGSVRAEKQGGGGLPKPRIDYPLDREWRFYRTETEGFPGYRDRAMHLLSATRPDGGRIFDANIRVWGTLMIERTAAGDTSAIKTPARSTAARINLHLHRQTFYGDPVGLHDTDDEWAG